MAIVATISVCSSQVRNGGGVDWYDGGTGTDTLVISLTADQFSDAGILSDLVALNEFIADNSKRGHRFRRQVDILQSGFEGSGLGRPGCAR